MRIEINESNKKVIEDLKIYFNEKTTSRCLNRLLEEIERKNLIVQNYLIKSKMKEIEHLIDVGSCLIKEMEKTIKDASHH